MITKIEASARELYTIEEGKGKNKKQVENQTPFFTYKHETYDDEAVEKLINFVMDALDSDPLPNGHECELTIKLNIYRG